ncbi:unnamed protein product [Phyllotreta striolata]|uniref:Uncharacterized protein n=1 Tax=Phyllotreta striolata TaxID=444603 RepID=A0A9N9TKF2_PHYSR|nr:unnamed protein product [Phyllotreta striolata]
MLNYDGICHSIGYGSDRPLRHVRINNDREYRTRKYVVCCFDNTVSFQNKLYSSSFQTLQNSWIKEPSDISLIRRQL